ncbi:DUF6455 family protein [Gemmobacter denitrificans]|uniref:DUF6455 family protein n=1 Tax=Gemmobacter denitrificans TaxID=3123040 RepID=A0ABU8BRM5_9RHOB
MIGYVEAPKAWWLTHGMARRAGVSLPQAVTDGWLKRSELACLIARCQACGSESDCTNWLAVPGPSLPEFCCNKAEIEALAPPR